MKKRLKWIGILAIGAALLLGLFAWLLLSFVLIRPASFEPMGKLEQIVLRSWDEHDAIYNKTSFPYVLELNGKTGSLLYVGCKHVSEATDPQHTELKRLWREFRPTVALCEGRERLNRYSAIPNTGPLTEAQLVRMLAYQSGTTLYTLEPSYEKEVEGLLQKHEAKLVAAYFVLRMFTSESQGQHGESDALLLESIEKRTNVNGLRGTFTSIADFDSYWKANFPNEPDWRNLSSTESVSLLASVGNTSRDVRGNHMVQSIHELVQRGERVFAVVGASHVIRQERALQESLEQRSTSK